MNKLKNLAIAFFIGFFLSFLAGLIGGVNFGVVLLRAVLSGGVFSLLVFGAITVYNTYLSGVAQTEQVEAQAATPGGQNTVDIVVDDELPDSATAPSFNLADYAQTTGDNIPQINEGDKENEVQEIPDAKPAFQASSLDSITNMPTEAGEAVSVEAAPPAGSAFNINEARPIQSTVMQNDDAEAVEEIDELPDIEALGLDEDGDSAGSADEIIEDSVFAETGNTRPSADPVPVSDLGDTKEIAAAIRTALAKDV